LRRLILFFTIAAASTCANGGQDKPFAGLKHRYDIPSTCHELTMTMRQDSGGRPFLYVAAKEGGLKVYELASAPKLVATVPAQRLESLNVMNLSQSGERLFLALGDHFSRQQGTGVAVIDVHDPTEPRVLDIWADMSMRSGAGIVEAAKNRVYLGAMHDGLLTFKLTQSGSLHLLSQFTPELAFPDEKPDPRKINARGMAVRNGLVYLAYDAGGLRIIDVRDPKAPTEVGRYSNQVMNGKPRAYNNVDLDGNLAYVTVDYCGLEVLDISDPGAVEQLSWWNPHNCQQSPWKWFSSPTHTNELAVDKDCDLVFMSSGKSDLQIVDVADPSAPVHAGEYGGVGNKRGTWGVSKQGDHVFLSYICTLGIPFRSNWTGVSVLQFDGQCPTTGRDSTASGQNGK